MWVTLKFLRRGVWLSKPSWLTKISTRNASRLVYDEFGDPSQVVRFEKFDTPTASGPKDVVVRILSSPIHPSHVNTIQGVYAIKPDSFPAVGGGEGVGRVLEVGSDVRNLKMGDLVYPLMPGTWTTHLKGEEKDFDPVQNAKLIGIPELSILRVNPGTAYRMLRDFVGLESGDVVVQSGANSAVGQAVIQIAKSMGLITVNVVRDRNNMEELKSELIGLGADYVLTSEEIRKTALFREKRLKKPRLALDCVGGEVGTEIAKILDFRGVHVTYGRMSPKPVMLPTTSLIFKDVSFKGFWMTRWVKENVGSHDVKVMYKDLENMMVNGTLRMPHYTLVNVKDHAEVLEKVTKGFKNTKFIFDFESAET